MTEPTPAGQRLGCLIVLFAMAATAALIFFAVAASTR
jgi:hypothetical protein